MITVTKGEILTTHPDGRERFVTKQHVICPNCEGEVVRIGTYNRTYINPDGEEKEIILTRVKCKECGRTHILLPDFLLPFKRHCRETIETIIDMAPAIEPVKARNDQPDASLLPVERSTIYKIKKWFARKAADFSEALTAIIKREPELKNKIKPYINCWANPQRDRGWTRNVVNFLVFFNFYNHTRSAL